MARRQMVHFFHFLLNIAVLILSSSHSAKGKCSRLPSGNCWVNCMQDIYDVICNNVTAEQVQSDISVFAHSPQQLRLYLWLSPTISRLSADVFDSVASQIVALDLQDLTSLDTFPELYNLENLERLNIWNSSLITDFPVELLPTSIKELSLNKIGVTNLVNDFMETPSLPSLTMLILRNLSISSWQTKFLEALPSLTHFMIANSTINLSNDTDQRFPAVKNLQSFTLTYNNFVSQRTSSEQQVKHVSAAFMRIIEALQLQPDAAVDLSHNNIELSDGVLSAIGRLSSASSLNLRGNPIAVNSTTDLSGFFGYFDRLRLLDLGETNITGHGLLRGLPTLTEVYLDHNHLGTDAQQHNVFQGLSAVNLTIVDLSHNNLTTLPDIPQEVAAAIRTLNLRYNNLTVFENDRSDHAVTEAYFAAFKNLQSLDLSSNNLSTFAGVTLRQLKNIDFLDLSCNNFKNITKEIFFGISDTLRELNMSMCIHPPQPAPFVNMDAFSTLPPVTIFRMNSAQLKKSIFSALNESASRLYNLTHLYLEDNIVTYLSQDNIPHLTHLKLLSLRGNNLQSIQPHTFGNLPELQTLDIANNRISSIGTDNFAQGRTSLQNLEYLNLESNGIDRIERGSFDNLLKLKSLLLGNNSAEVQDLFLDQDGGKELVYFGIQSYNNSCLRPALFSKLKKLRWLLNDVYSFLVVNPDASLLTRDDYLLSIIKRCAEGSVITSRKGYPGLSNYVSVTTHDADDVDQGLQYPVLATFAPLTYCPDAQMLQDLSNKICSNADQKNFVSNNAVA
ncbi:toll-like receptor 3 [Paramacrobiotus metropolitanus]|uniref:toll-like receptor 3 n=1 Tax=Paramacrobiotus metropolitanus TaxID=2943436 RepID=UPI00244633DA|nr:toll-like receptor 3 [Paramacrobiotus metropolitanus]